MELVCRRAQELVFVLDSGAFSTSLSFLSSVAYDDLGKDEYRLAWLVLVRTAERVVDPTFVHHSQTLTSFVQAFGFVSLVPQLVINYKLKSVAVRPSFTLST